MLVVRLFVSLVLVVLAGPFACSSGGRVGSLNDADISGIDDAPPDVVVVDEAEPGDRIGSDLFQDDGVEGDVGDVGSDSVADALASDAALADGDASLVDSAEAIDDDGPGSDVSETNEPLVYAPEYCAYFMTGEVDLLGTDADGDGVSNGWDHCPNNPYDWLDSDRDGIGNRSDPDMDGDGIPNDVDSDRDGDGVDDTVEEAAGTDPTDPSSIPGLPRLEVDLGVWNAKPGWYKTDLHIHCSYSHDSSSSLTAYPPACKTTGLDFLAITDHDVFNAPFDPAWVQDTCLMVPGMEWGGSGGHANQWGIRTLNDAVPDTPDQIRKSWRLARLQGGVQSLNHYGADMDTLAPLFAAAPDLYDALDVIEVWNSPWAFNTKANEPAIQLWESLLNQGYHIGAVGGGDSHTPILTVSSPTTVVWAESLSVPGILHGIRKGRTYITQADSLAFTGRPELDFRIDADGDGVFEAMLGDEVPPGFITLQVNVVNAKGPVVLIRNGVELTRFEGHASGATIAQKLADNAPPKAWYRVQMRESMLSFSPMRLFSSAIYVGE
jgi:hypothetical protein